MAAPGEASSDEQLEERERQAELLSHLSSIEERLARLEDRAR